jgi:hypothetical protein
MTPQKNPPGTTGAFNAKAPAVRLPPGFTVDKRDADGTTLLMEAARQNLPAKVLECLQQGSDINAVDKNGATPLMYAIENKAADCAVLLANKGADLSLKNRQGMNALMMACQHPQGIMTEVIETLVRRGSPLDERGSVTCATALIHAIYNHDVWAACRLVRAGADYKTIGDKQGRTAERLGTQNFSGKDLAFFKDAMTEIETRAEREAAAAKTRFENDIHKATVLQRPLTGMKKLVITKPKNRTPGR